MVYLDYAATGVVSKKVIETMREAELEFFANSSALHTPGHLAKNQIEIVREKFAKMVGAEPEEIIFTSGATESNNTIVRTFEGHEIEVSDLEHHSILETARIYRGDKKPKLYSYMLANNETGDFLDIETLIKRAHDEGGFFHSDLTQVLGKIPIDVKTLGLDYATFSAHKIGGPVGVGILYIKKGMPFKPLLIGGNQEQGRRGGTYNTVGIVGLGAALDEIAEQQAFLKYDTKVRELRDTLAERILAEIKGSSLNTELGPKKSLPNILNVSFRAAEGEAIQLYLDAEDIIVSTGSACAAGNGRPSHVLMAKTGDAEIVHSSIRFSFGLSNTMEDVEKVMAVLPKIIDKLQKMSTIEL